MTRPDSHDRAGLAAHPPNAAPAYASTRTRAPTLPAIAIPQGPGETSGPQFGTGDAPPTADLTRHGGGEALGERIIVTGRVLDETGRPVPGTLVEIWQANAAGRYVHERDQHDAPLDPHFRGVGRVATDAQGCYRFTTIRPGAYPWANHPNAWRPAHIHFSLFGPSFLSRLVTQMYFPGDPLLPLDPILDAVPAHARDRLVSAFDLGVTEPGRALGYRFDIVLRGPRATPAEGQAS